MRIVWTEFSLAIEREKGSSDYNRRKEREN